MKSVLCATRGARRGIRMVGITSSSRPAVPAPPVVHCRSAATGSPDLRPGDWELNARASSAGSPKGDPPRPSRSACHGPPPTLSVELSPRFEGSSTRISLIARNGFRPTLLPYRFSGGVYTERDGEYLLKPVPSTPGLSFQSDIPANEHLTMQLAGQSRGSRYRRTGSSSFPTDRRPTS